MIAFRGRLGFRQYLPAKPTKYGIKLWCRVDPTNSYLNEFQVYTGREGRRIETGLATRVVLDLTEKISNKWHIVNTDNYFSSPGLSSQLLDRGTYSRGTVRINQRDFPTNLLEIKTLKNQGDYKAAKKGDMIAAAWKDKKVICLLSSAEDLATLAAQVQRKQRNGAVQMVNAPSIVGQYNNK